MSASSLAALALVVPDYDSAIAFFTATLGFRLTADLPQTASDGRRKRWVTVEPPGGGARIVLAQAEGDRQAAAIGDQCGGRVFLFLETDDFARDHTALLAAGIRFEEAPRQEPYGTVAVWRDPWGNRWDLIQPRAPAA